MKLSREALGKLRSENNRRYWADPVKRKKRIAAMKKGFTDAVKKVMSIKQKAAWADPKKKKSRVASMLAYKSKRPYRLNQSLVHKKLWNSKRGVKLREEAKQRACKIAIKINEPPNKAEKLLLKMLNLNFGSVFKLNFGVTRKIIGRKIPDILHKTKPFIVELFGDHWHSFKRTGRNRNSEVRHRVDFFKKLGYKTAVVWASDLRKGFKRCTIIKRIARTFKIGPKVVYAN